MKQRSPSGSARSPRKRRTTKIQLEQAKTRSQKKKLSNEYSELQKEVKRKAKLDKRKYINQLATEAENAMTRNDTKTVYNITKQLAGKKTNASRPIRERWKHNTEYEKKIERGKDYVCVLLNRNKIAKALTRGRYKTTVTT